MKMTPLEKQTVRCLRSCAMMQCAFIAWALLAAQTLADQQASPWLNDQLNGGLAALGVDYRLGKIETFTTSASMGTTILFDDRNKRLEFQYVPFDPDRHGGREIFWVNDLTEAVTTSGLTTSETSTAIRSAMGTWDAVPATDIPLVDLGDVNLDLGVAQFILSGGTEGSPSPIADISQAGFLPQGFFESLEPGGGDAFLATTFTFFFNSDINDDGKLDTAFTETYYNDGFDWSVDEFAEGTIDVESVALHEAGHALSQDHFGKGFATDSNGEFHLAPEAVMNAFYTSPLRELTGTDIAGHVSIWADWPLGRGGVAGGLVGAAGVPEPGTRSLLIASLGAFLMVQRIR